MSKDLQSTSRAPSSPQRIWSNNGSEKTIINNDEQYKNGSKVCQINQNIFMQQLANLDITERKLDQNQQSSIALNGSNNNKQVQFTIAGTNQEFLRDAPNIRATKIDSLIQKNGDSGEDIYMGTHAKERFREKHLTFFQKRLLNTITSENENDTFDRKRKTANQNNNSNHINNVKESNRGGNKQNDSFQKNTTALNNPTIPKDSARNGIQVTFNGTQNGPNQVLNQSMRKGEFNKSDTTKKKIHEKDTSERMWGIKMWQFCIIGCVIGSILSVLSFYISNSYSQSNVLCFIIYPISAVLLQTSLIAIQRLIFIKIKVIEQQKAQLTLFQREKVNHKRFYTWRYFYRVYSNVSIRLILISLVTAIVYAPIVEQIILPKLQPSGGMQELDDNGDFKHSLEDRRTYLLIQVVLRFGWVYFIGAFNYILLNQEYTRIEHLTKTEQNQNADRNQYIGQIYKEFENDLIKLENRMHVGLNQGQKIRTTHTMAEYLKVSHNDPSSANPQKGTINNSNAANNTNTNILIPPITTDQRLSKKQSLLQFQVDAKKLNGVEVNTTNNILSGGGKVFSINQIETKDLGGGAGQNPKELQKQRMIERKRQREELHLESVRDLLQFWIKISREDISAMIQNIFVALTIFFISIVLTLNILTHYLLQESEPAYYATFFLYLVFISIVFFKGVYPIRRRQQEISKKVIRPIFFIFASVGATSLHFEIASYFRQTYILSIIKFFIIIVFLHFVPWVQQIILERDIQKEVENVFRKSMTSGKGGGGGGGVRKAKTNRSTDFRPSHIVDIREINHFNDEKKVYQQNRLTLIQFLVAFSFTDIASSVSFIAVTFFSHFNDSQQLLSVYHTKHEYYNIYLDLAGEIIIFLLLIILTIYFFKRSIANSEFDTLKNYSFVTYTRDLVISNITSILLVYIFAWHFVLLVLNN